MGKAGGKKVVNAIDLPRLFVVRRTEGGRVSWWIRGLPDPTCPENGPYATRKEAEEDRRGLLRTFQYGHKRSFWTGEK